MATQSSTLRVVTSVVFLPRLVKTSVTHSKVWLYSTIQFHTTICALRTYITIAASFTALLYLFTLFTRLAATLAESSLIESRVWLQAASLA